MNMDPTGQYWSACHCKEQDPIPNKNTVIQAMWYTLNLIILVLINTNW
jgi:hypothetical protein